LNTASGIYEIVNLRDGKRYIGSAVSMDARFAVHRSSLKKTSHHSRHLQRAWNKHGSGSFVFRPLIVCAKRDLLFYEQRFIDAMRPAYNSARVAGSCLGVKFSEETKAQLSAQRRAKNHMRGKKHTAETIAKMSQAKMGNTATKGKTRSVEAVAKTAAAHRGMKRSPETCANIAAKAVGRSRSAESIEKGAAKRRGVPLSPTHRATLLGNTHAAGVTQSPELRAQKSAALKAAWAAKKAAGIPWRPKPSRQS
jgi:group I intron endonuclease